MDFRTKTTLRSIDEALIEALVERHARPVTVTEVCKRAGIDQATLYRCYKDIGDLIAQTEEGAIAKLDEKLDRDDLDLKARLLLMMEDVRTDRMRYAALFSAGENPSFPIRVLSRAFVRTGHDLWDLLPGRTEAERLWAFDFMAHGLSALWRDWVEQGMAEPVHDVAAFAFALMQNGTGPLMDPAEAGAIGDDGLI